mmetsp:Transcript_8948/g.16100  ORF Transcript_8948/g.16100 Transcript_8948/m.16100 type:complete len:407 (+) Transcript_8948:55-1275(+)
MATATRVHPKPRSKLKGSLVAFIAWLRRVDASFPLSQTLSLIGASLLIVSLLRGISLLVIEHPHVLTACAGAVCMAIATVANKAGLARLLPPRWQYLLLHRTPFDLVFDECVHAGLLRRWGRVLLLCQERSESEVRAIVRGLDPEFLDDVLQRSMVEMLPSVLRGLLLPGDPTVVGEHPMDAASSAVRTQSQLSLCNGSWYAGQKAAIVDDYESRYMGMAPRQQDGELTSEEICEVLQQKAAQKRSRSRSSEPALSPLIDMLLKLGSVDGSLPAAARYVAHQGLHLASITAWASSGVWTLSTVFFCTPAARRALQSIIFSGDARTASRRANYAANLLAGLSFLGASACVLLAVHIRRHWLRTVLPPTRGEIKGIAMSPAVRRVEVVTDANGLTALAEEDRSKAASV